MIGVDKGVQREPERGNREGIRRVNQTRARSTECLLIGTCSAEPTSFMYCTNLPTICGTVAAAIRRQRRNKMRGGSGGAGGGTGAGQHSCRARGRLKPRLGGGGRGSTRECRAL